jgi:hypothetical protein
VLVDVVAMRLPSTSTTLHHFLLFEFALAFAAVQWPLASPSTKGKHQEFLDRGVDEGLKKTAFDGWQLKTRPVWDVLGPFPQSAREQHFLSPSYPLDRKSDIVMNYAF